MPDTLCTLCHLCGPRQIITTTVEHTKSGCEAEDDAQQCGGGVVIAIPFCYLLDSLLQSFGILGVVCKENYLKLKVSWLGRPAEDRGSLCTSDETLGDLVFEYVHTVRVESQELEAQRLRLAFQEIRRTYCT